MQAALVLCGYEGIPKGGGIQSVLGQKGMDSIEHGLIDRLDRKVRKQIVGHGRVKPQIR